MKAIKKLLWTFAACLMLSVGCISCVNQRYLIFEEDEFSGAEYSGDNMLLNGEIELDDYER